jgi:hypothetical protein
VVSLSGIRFQLEDVGVEQQDGIKREHLLIQSAPGVRVFVYLYHPPGGETKGARGVILLHGPLRPITRRCSGGCVKT